MQCCLEEHNMLWRSTKATCESYGIHLVEFGDPSNNIYMDYDVSRRAQHFLEIYESYEIHVVKFGDPTCNIYIAYNAS